MLQMGPTADMAPEELQTLAVAMCAALKQLEPLDEALKVIPPRHCDLLVQDPRERGRPEIVICGSLPLCDRDVEKVPFESDCVVPETCFSSKTPKTCSAPSINQLSPLQN